jgi:hypothetical protein
MIVITLGWLLYRRLAKDEGQAGVGNFVQL